MPNPIKYSTSAQTLALKKGNFWIGTGDVGKGPTSTTDYYNGVSPSGGYTIYLNKSSGGPSIYRPANDSQLISLTNTIAGTNYSNSADCLNWFATQTDKMVFNTDYPAIVTNGLILSLDSGFTPSYPTTGTSWYDLSGNGRNGTLYNGVSYQNGGFLAFDYSNDFVGNFVDSSLGTPSTFTLSAWVRSSDISQPQNIFNANPPFFLRITSSTMRCCVYTGSWIFVNGSITLSSNVWYNLVLTYDQSYVKGYVNSVLDVNSQKTGSPIWGSLNSIGYTTGGEDAPSVTNIANAMIYNRALSAAEVLQNYNAQNYLGSIFNPASSAVAILAANPSAPDGYYWINTSLGARNLYCIMSQGGWMGMTSELCPQTSNVQTSASWETNTSGRLQGSNASILNVSVVETGCGGTSYYQLQSPSTRGLSYTQSMLLMQRISTIGQCSAITNGSNSGYYTGPEYTGSYTASGMCTWGDGNFANACCDNAITSNLKAYWVLLGSGTNPSLYYQVQCASGSGQHYHMWFIK
jgi:hypothetical protein